MSAACWLSSTCLPSASLAAHFVSERLRIAARRRRSMRILISGHPHWRRRIELGFALSGDEIVFADDRRSLVERLEMERFDRRPFDLVIPLHVAELRQLGALGPRIARNPLPIPSLAAIDLCNDKRRLNERLVELGFGDHVPTMDGSPACPYVLKRREGDGSTSTHLVESAEDETRLAAQRADPAYFVQTLVRGPHEHATHLLMKQGRIVRSLTIRHSFATDRPILNRTSRINRRIETCPHLELFARILRAIGFEGLCCIDHKPFDGRPMILEINPRCGGSLAPFLFSIVADLEPLPAARR